MTGASLEVADELHAFGRTRQIHYHAVRHELFEAFSREAAALSARLGEDAADSFWLDFGRTVRRFRFELSATPIAFNDLVATGRLNLTGLRAFARRVEYVYPDEARATRSEEHTS